MRQRSLEIVVPSGLILLIALLLSAGFFPNRFLSAAAQESTSTGREIQDKGDTLKIEPGVPVERTLSGGEAHTYEINLNVDQFIHIIVEQRGIDVALTLYGPDGKQIAEVDSPNGTQGLEPVSMIAETSGDYRVKVASPNKTAAAGRYVIRIEALRLATSPDRDRVVAERILQEGDQLRGKRNAESLPKAIAKYEQALLLIRAVGDQSLEANALNNIASVYWQSGNMRKALEYSNQALPLRRAMGDKAGEASTLNDIGLVYSQLGEMPKALEYLKESLELRRAVGDHAGEAVTLNNLGLTYQGLGELQKALEHYSLALPLRRAVADRAGEAVTLNNMGVTYQRLGELQKALEYYNQALPLRRAVGNRLGEATTLNNIGLAYWELRELEKALEYYNQALPLSHAVGDRSGEAAALSNIGLIYHKQGQVQKALEYYNQALPMRRAVSDPSGEAVTLNNIGRAHKDLKDSQKALEYYGQAITISRDIGDRNREAIVLYDMAHCERDLGHLIEARAEIEAAISLIESMRARVTSQELRTSYLGSQQGYYEFYVDLLMRLHASKPAEGYDAAALQISERARARSLVELLNEARVEIRQGVDPALLARERSLQQQIGTKAELQIRLLSRKSAEEQVSALKKETDELVAAYEEIKAQIRINSPRYAALTQPVPLSLREIQQLLAPDTLLLEYRLGDDASYLWAVTSTSIKSFALPDRKEIEGAARDVYDLLTARNLTPKFETPDERQIRIAKADAEYPGAAALLSEMVLAPVVNQLGTKRLLIVSDGALQYVPFSALPLPGQTVATVSRKASKPARSEAFLPLVAEHEIVDLPSASTLAVLRRDSRDRQAPPRKLAIIADPVFEKGDQRVKGQHLMTVRTASAESRHERGVSESTAGYDILRSARESGFDEDAFQIPRLPFTRREANEIAALVPAAKRKVSLDFAANRAAAMAPELEQYQYVHFATHSLLNTVHPELSGIVLSMVDKDGQEQDGFLRGFEVFNLKLNADMVVLSGCRTGLGKEIKGEGFLGLTRGFMYAGAQRVLVSLWGVTDEASAQLMVQTYKGMLGRARLRPAAALRAAQLEMLKDKRWQAPYYWAAFVLQGEPN